MSDESFQDFPYGEHVPKPTIPEYDLKDGLKKLVSSIEQELEKKDVVIVAIAGGSASGKTSQVADMVQEVFGENAVSIPIDNYYGAKYMQEQAEKGNDLNWDQPEAINLDLLQEHLGQLSAGQEISMPIYDMKISEKIGEKEVKPTKVIIIEGIFALNDILKKQADIRVFIDVGTHGRILRRLLRDIERTGKKPADILKEFAEVVEPMHEKYIKSTKKNADMIINNEYSPDVEAERSGLHEVQLKFKGEIDQEQLRKLGAQRLSTVIQVDHYYTPSGRNYKAMVASGEILRIREERDKRIITYKGPKTEHRYSRRPTFEFEIDRDTEQSFLKIYGDQVKVIKKERTLYELGGVVLAQDLVYKIENNQVTNLGYFIEVRSTGHADEEKIEKVLKKLGLNSNEGIKESYFEM